MVNQLSVVHLYGQKGFFSHVKKSKFTTSHVDHGEPKIADSQLTVRSLSDRR